MVFCACIAVPAAPRRMRGYLGSHAFPSHVIDLNKQLGRFSNITSWHGGFTATRILTKVNL
jgi:hypothetical protein